MIEYRECPGFPGYAVGNDGSVARISTVDTIGRRIKGGRLTPALDSDGYQKVHLRDGKRVKTFRVHTLILTAFLGPAEGKEANHKNGSRADNRIENLEWLTHAENIRATYAAGRGVQQQPGYKNPRRAEARAARAAFRAVPGLRGE